MPIFIGNGSASGEQVDLFKAQLDLDNVDNTSDVDKPVSTSMQTSLALKSNISDLASTASGKGASTVGTEDGRTVQGVLTPMIWKRLPSLEGGVVPGDSAATYTRLQTQINRLATMGGGQLDLVEDIITINRPLIVPEKVSIIGPGRDRCLVNNDYPGYLASNSAILATGNLHPQFTQLFYGHAQSKAVDVAVSGDGGLVLTNSGDASGFLVGDTIMILSNESYAAGGGQIAHYMVPRKVSRIDGAIVYIDEPLWDALPTGGIIHNLRTTTVMGDPPAVGASAIPLFIWGDAEMAGFSCETIGNWISPASGAYKGRMHDLGVRSRRIWYVNSFVHTVMDNVSGGFIIKAGEASLNCEDFIVKNSSATYDVALKAASDAAGISLAPPYGGISMQENSHFVTWRNLDINLTGMPDGSVCSINNAEHCTIDDVRTRNGDPAFGANAMTIANLAIATNRRGAAYNTVRKYKWDGRCASYLTLAGADALGNSIDIQATGPLTTAIGVIIDGTVGRNVLEPSCYFEQGRLDFTNSAANTEVINCYIGGGTSAIVTTDFTELENNNVRRVRTTNSAARRPVNAMLPAAIAHTGTTANTTIITKSMGTNTIQTMDKFFWEARINVTGTTGIKSVYMRIRNETDGIEYSLAGFNIPAATTGVITLKGDATVVNTATVMGHGAASNSAVTTTPGSVTATLSGKLISIKLDASLVNASDTITFNMVQIGLDNPVQG